MCREKGAVKHDDRVDALALGVKHFQDILAISSREALILEKRQEWNNMLNMFIEQPTLATDMLVAGRSFNDTEIQGDTTVYSWIS
jgi:hypothetical protein